MRREPVIHVLGECFVIGVRSEFTAFPTLASLLSATYNAPALSWFIH
jgi:hypothetical protein